MCFAIKADAPGYYNFNEGSPGNADRWFNQRKSDSEPSSDEDEPMEDAEVNCQATSKEGDGLPLSAIQNSGNPPMDCQEPKLASLPEKRQEEEPPAPQRVRPTNTVSSWDHHSLNVKKAYAHQMGPQQAHGNVKRRANPPNALDQPPRKFPRINNRVTRRKKEALTTEERQMLKAQEEAAQAAAKRKEQAAKLGRILSRKHNGASRSLKALTLPHEFNFATSTRARPATSNNDSSFIVPQTQAEYKPLAVRMKDFDKTPERFKPLPCGAPNIPKFPPRQRITLTVPRGPRLHTAGRIRGKHPEGPDEKQQKLLPPCGGTRKRKIPDDGFNADIDEQGLKRERNQM